MPKTRPIAAAILLLACLHAAAQRPPAEHPPSRPNIVLVFVDDMGPSDLACYGSPFYETPHVDALAAGGARFTQAYAACTVCSPSRVSLLTGQYPARTRVTDWIPGWGRNHTDRPLLEPPDWRRGLLDEWTTLPELLAEHGYATAWFGKWHAGGAPGVHGFDEFYHDWHYNGADDPSDPKGVHALTDMATSFLERRQDQPMFVVISHFSVHTPIRFDPAVRDRHRERRREGEPQQLPAYAAMVEALDDSVGRLTAFLERSGLDDHTLVVFTSDNGGYDRGGARGPTDNHPFRAGKGTQYEGGLRVPLILRWPGRIPAGVETDALATTPDLLPTFAARAGIPDAALPNDLDGVDLWPATQREPLADRALFWHYPHWHEGAPGSTIRRGDLKLIYRPVTDTVELYDLAVDPGESHDLARERPRDADRLRSELFEWLDAVDAQPMIENPNREDRRARSAP